MPTSGTTTSGACTYSGDPGATARDLVRHLIGDTGFDGRWFLSDGEVDYEVTAWTNNAASPAVVRPYTAAAAAIRTMSARVAQRPDVVDGDAQAKYSQQMVAFDKLTKQLDSQARSIDGLAPFEGTPDGLGLTSVDDGPYFRIGMHDTPFAPSNKVENNDPSPNWPSPFLP